MARLLQTLTNNTLANIDNSTINNSTIINSTVTPNIIPIDPIVVTSSLDVKTLIIIIVSAVIVILIIILVIYLCKRKSAQNNKPLDNIELEVQVKENLDQKSQKSGLKKFLIIQDEVDKKEEIKISDKSDSKDITQMTDRKLLDKSQNNREELNLIDSLGLGEIKYNQDNENNYEDENNLNVSQLEASFRTDLYNIESQKGKIEDLIKNQNIIMPLDILSNQSKTSKDIVSHDIHNYTEGNRADFYTEEDQPEEEQEEDIEYNYNYNLKEDIDLKKNSINQPSTNGTQANSNKHAEQEMSPQEHSDFMNADEDEEEDEEYENDYQNYLNQLNNKNEYKDNDF